MEGQKGHNIKPLKITTSIILICVSTVILMLTVYTKHIPDSFEQTVQIEPIQEIQLKIQNGWEISIVNEPLESLFPMIVEKGYIAYGVTRSRTYQDKDNIQRFIKDGSRIYMYGTTTAIVNSLIHEIGHAVDLSYSDRVLSGTEEWKNIYELEKNQFCLYQSETLKQETSNEREYFASIFELIVADEITDEEIKNNVPLSYEYVKTIVEGERNNEEY